MNRYRDIYPAVLAMLVLISMLGCSSASGEPSMVGRIVDKDGGEILVAEGVTKEAIADGLDINDLLASSDKYPNACWVKVGLNWYKVGDKVEVWYNGSEDSYPCQATADKVKRSDE
ncbi:hypothetical protein DNH61_02855 [Paenibacillus sambharensis]|uniref:DUF3221 domain-containing protein n=1 Tax=Paenibacillus sambharensis TaxID=1803190 RepID=A0A2W1LF44_9BACL|nr:DUF3221 domain-containing protein [Paenibacillus sambharensis]PZD97309.1 hypothetical protein DNH61_02855 [Paenibacillus sambharensis]